MHAHLSSVTVPTEEEEGKGGGDRDSWAIFLRLTVGQLGVTWATRACSCLLVLLLDGYLAFSPFSRTSRLVVKRAVGQGQDTKRQDADLCDRSARLEMEVRGLGGWRLAWLVASLLSMHRFARNL